MEPEAGKCYAILVDVAGEDEGAADSTSDQAIEALANPKRDNPTLTIVEVDLSTLTDPVIKAPTYKAVQR